MALAALSGKSSKNWLPEVPTCLEGFHDLLGHPDSRRRQCLGGQKSTWLHFGLRTLNFSIPTSNTGKDGTWVWQGSF